MTFFAKINYVHKNLILMIFKQLSSVSLITLEVIILISFYCISN
jgi:hypothetical protein